MPFNSPVTDFTNNTDVRSNDFIYYTLEVSTNNNVHKHSESIEKYWGYSRMCINCNFVKSKHISITEIKCFEKRIEK